MGRHASILFGLTTLVASFRSFLYRSCSHLHSIFSPIVLYPSNFQPLRPGGQRWGGRLGMGGGPKLSIALFIHIIGFNSYVITSFGAHNY